MTEIDPITIRLSLEERRTERMTGLVKPSTKADWEIIQADTPMSVGDLIAWSVKLLKQHPNIMSKDYELKEKE